MTYSNDMSSQPLVSIGLPVRNGGILLEEALELLVSQTYTNIEIIISDNNSSDETESIGKKFSQRDSRVKYFRQAETLTALNNFKFVFEHSIGDYFMWAAYDDRRSRNYIEVLLAALLKTADAAIMFSDVAIFHDYSDWRNSKTVDYDFQTSQDMSLLALLKKNVNVNSLHFYGLIRRRFIEKCPWTEIDFGPDIPIIVYLSIRGIFSYVAGSKFFYYQPISPKKDEDRAKENSLHRLKPCREVRLSWLIAKYAAVGLAQKTGAFIPPVFLFSFIYFFRHWRWMKPALFNRTPKFLITHWRKYKAWRVTKHE